jgi:hypothetical protein
MELTGAVYVPATRGLVGGIFPKPLIWKLPETYKVSLGLNCLCWPVVASIPIKLKLPIRV